MNPVGAVIFDYGGVLRGDGRDIWLDADAGAGLSAGTLWAAWHDVPEYRLSREGAIVSADVGLAKPDTAIFRLAAHRLGVSPQACLMIDDQAQHVEGARAAGLRALLHRPARMGELIAWLASEGALA